MANLKLVSKSELFNVYADSNLADDIENNYSGYVPDFIVGNEWGMIRAKQDKRIKFDIQDINDTAITTNFDNTYLVILSGDLTLNGKKYNQWHILKKQQSGQIVCDSISQNLSVAFVLED